MPSTDLTICPLAPAPETLRQLVTLLIETVAHGGSVSFMHPLSEHEARAFWDKSLAAAERGGRIVFGAFEGDALLGSVTLLLDCPPNQLHRGEIAKMMTRVAHRGRGIATALLKQAEAVAIQRDRTLLTLDTASEEGASALYENCGFTYAGEIPDYALKPHGGLTGARIYWKRIGAIADAGRLG